MKTLVRPSLLFAALILTACGGMRSQDQIGSPKPINATTGSAMGIASIDGAEPIMVTRWRDPETGGHGTAAGIIDQNGWLGMGQRAYREGNLIVASRLPAAGLHPVTMCSYTVQAPGQYSHDSFFSSTDTGCEGRSLATGVTIYLADAPMDNMVIPLWRCYSPLAGDHLDTTNPAGECNLKTGYHTEYVLGFGS